MNKLIQFIRNYWISITLTALVAVTALSLWPLQTLPTVPGSDKVHHFIAYGALMFPIALRKPGYWLLLGLLLVCWSGAIELIQPYVNRYGEWMDMAANSTGIICGLFAAQLINWIFPGNQEKN